MWVHSEETRCYWFNRASLEAEAFRLVGQLMGLAIYNSVIIEAHFPLALYTKLLGKAASFEARARAHRRASHEEPSLGCRPSISMSCTHAAHLPQLGRLRRISGCEDVEQGLYASENRVLVSPSAQDLKAAMPELGRGLQQLLDFEGDVEGTFARSFEARVCAGAPRRSCCPSHVPQEKLPRAAVLAAAPPAPWHRLSNICVDMQPRLPCSDFGLSTACTARLQVEYDFFGELRREELKPGGAGIPVTADNRAEFVALMTDYYLNRSVAPMFSTFSAGFHEVCALPPLTLRLPLPRLFLV